MSKNKLKQIIQEEIMNHDTTSNVSNDILNVIKEMIENRTQNQSDYLEILNQLQMDIEGFKNTFVVYN